MIVGAPRPAPYCACVRTSEDDSHGHGVEVAGAWGQDTAFMASHVGGSAAIAMLVNASALLVVGIDLESCL